MYVLAAVADYSLIGLSAQLDNCCAIVEPIFVGGSARIKDRHGVSHHGRIG